MKKILVLNDELGTQMQIYLALCDAYKVEIAEDLESVMYYLRKMKPEIFLLDYTLKQFNSNGKDGIDLLKKIKKKYSNLKIVLLMDAEHKTFEESAHANGADGILYKPIKNHNLITNVNKLAQLETSKVGP